MKKKSLDLPSDPESPERRAFTVQSVLAILSGVTITISGCGDGDSPMSPSPGQGGRSGTVSANHGHNAVITAAEIMTGNAVVLNIRGSATHPHTVELSAAEVMQIGAGQRVSKLSSTDDSPDAGIHSHNVIFN
ncbi:MAG TPA: hypothetical protein VLD67_15555 [Vicinamibacterales bacterium]|nr:hypothetical protein [Vicinamibacterales bacterium]